MAISESPDAASGEKPRPIRTAPVIATGVPKPEAPSKNAPNANAISNSCRRRSVVTPPIARFSNSKRPVSTVMRYRKITLRTIQPIGKKPTTTPSSDARTDMSMGIWYTAIVMIFATIKATMAAICAFTLPLAISTSSVTTGTAAAIVDNVALPSGL